MRPKGVPFGYLEFSRAKRRELYTYIRTCTHARRRWRRRRRPAGRCRSRSRSGLGPGFLYLAWFFLNQVSWSSPPAERFESPANGCPREQIRPFANRCRKTDSAVGRLIGCDGSVRTVATAGIWRTRIPLRSAINSAPGVHSQTHQI